MQPYYQDDSVTLFNAKWEAVLPSLEPGSFHGVLTSPPYNKGDSLKNRKGGHTSNWQGYSGDWWYGDNMTDAEYQAGQQALLSECARLIAPGGAILYQSKAVSQKNVEIHPRDWVAPTPNLSIRETIIWHSKSCCQFNNGMFYPFHELLLWCYRKGDKPRHPLKECQQWTSVWEITPDTEAPWHPCAFPRELASRCIRALSEQGETWLDPYAGACTVGVAAKALGRKAILCETHEPYCEKASIRLQQQPLFVDVADRRPSQRALGMEDIRE